MPGPHGAPSEASRAAVTVCDMGIIPHIACQERVVTELRASCLGVNTGTDIDYRL